MQRRVTGWVCLLALVAAIVLVVALQKDPTLPRAAAPADPTGTPSTAVPSHDPAQRAERKARQQRQREQARIAAHTQELLTDHGCWSGQAPAGAVPGHAVVTLPGAEPTLVPADVGYGIWLDGDPGELHGFCP